MCACVGVAVRGLCNDSLALLPGLLLRLYDFACPVCLACHTPLVKPFVGLSGRLLSQGGWVVVVCDVVGVGASVGLPCPWGCWLGTGRGRTVTQPCQRDCLQLGTAVRGMVERHLVFTYVSSFNELSMASRSKLWKGTP